MAQGTETQKSLALLRSLFPASTAEKVEHWNHHARRRHDLFGFADVLVAGPDAGFLLVQVTTRGQMSARRSKILGKEQGGDKKPAEYAAYRLSACDSWLRAGGRVEVHGWHQPAGRGTKWECEVWEISQVEVCQALNGEIPRVSRKKNPLLGQT